MPLEALFGRCSVLLLCFVLWTSATVELAGAFHSGSGFFAVAPSRAPFPTASYQVHCHLFPVLRQFIASMAVGTFMLRGTRRLHWMACSFRATPQLGMAPSRMFRSSSRATGLRFDHPVYANELKPVKTFPLPPKGTGSACLVDPGHQCHVLEDVLQVITQCIDKDTQRWLASVIMQRGMERPGRGFWQIDDGCKQPNSSPRFGRGRVFDSIIAFPLMFRNICNAVLEAATTSDMTLPNMEPTHVRLVHYSGGQGVKPKIQWHRDEDPNDGQRDHPIISLSLGQACTLMFSRASPQQQSGLVHKVYLESGDAYIFGGKCRNMYHSVKAVHPGTCPSELLEVVGEARIAISFHDAPGIKTIDYVGFYTPGLERRAWEPLWRKTGNAVDADGD